MPSFDGYHSTLPPWPHPRNISKEFLRVASHASKRLPNIEKYLLLI